MSEDQFPNGTGNTEENIFPKEFLDNNHENSGANLDLNTNGEAAGGPGQEENNVDERNENQEEAVPNSLEGLDEIVSPSEASENDDIPPKEGDIDELAHIIEAIIFASDEPLNAGTIKSVLDAAHTFGRINQDMITSRINALNDKYDSDGNGFHIIEIAEGYQFATRKELAQWVSYLFKEKARRKLSNSALETLAIIAYKQPITKPEVESIRGVNVDYVLHNLLEKEIVTVIGRAETVGRPLLYGTTQRFLKLFALKNLEDLPKLREIAEIIKEIRSKGAEESIQLEITAFDDQPASESSDSAEPAGSNAPQSLADVAGETSVTKKPETSENNSKDDPIS